MCCFSGPVETVAQTSIFARYAGDGRQMLAYGMSYGAQADVAMVLPLPVAPGSGDDAVRFISLDSYPDFFNDLHELFAPPPSDGDLSTPRTDDAPAPPLPVHDVGVFEASFVPRPRDFDRLDPRFRMPPGLWTSCPGYADFGFAVFKLKPTQGPAVAHPMALSFPTRSPDLLYYPTVHVHDGEFHGTARFDHSLYAQFDALPKGFSFTVIQEHGTLSWDSTREAPGKRVKATRAQGLIDPEKRVVRVRLEGRRENADTWVGARTAMPQAIPEAAARADDYHRFAQEYPEGHAKYVARTNEMLASMRATNALWVAMTRHEVVQRFASEEEVTAWLPHATERINILDTRRDVDEQAGGLSRLQWAAGDR